MRFRPRRLNRTAKRRSDVRVRHRPQPELELSISRDGIPSGLTWHAFNR